MLWPRREDVLIGGPLTNYFHAAETRRGCTGLTANVLTVLLTRKGREIRKKKDIKACSGLNVSANRDSVLV